MAQTLRFPGSLGWISGGACLVDLTAYPGAQGRLSVGEPCVPSPAACWPALWTDGVKGAFLASPHWGSAEAGSLPFLEALGIWKDEKKKPKQGYTNFTRFPLTA